MNEHDILENYGFYLEFHCIVFHMDAFLYFYAKW